MVEVHIPGKPPCYEVRKVGGILLSQSDFAEEAARLAEACLLVIDAEQIDD